MIGRMTGDEEWRKARGEMGDGSLTGPHHSFTPSTKDLEAGCMDITYCCATNRYAQSGGDSLHDWKSGRNDQI